MSDDLKTTQALNELLAAHKRSLVLRLMDATPFVSAAEADLAETLRSVIREEAEHIDWLTTAIVELRGAPVSALPDPRTGSVHYVDLRYLLPRIVQDERRMLGVCESVLQRLVDPSAAALVSRIADCHRRHLDTLGAAASVSA